MIKMAAIVAAGVGNRMGNRTADRPKGFLEIDEMPIIEHSIAKLEKIGISKIVIGTGYLSETYERLALKYPQITCIRNREYISTGSMYTLYQLKDYIAEDFLLLESDLIYEKIALCSLIEHPRTDVILASGFTHSSDEVFIEVDENQHLVNMAKGMTERSRIYGELVGITKLSYSTFQKMCNFVDTVFPSKPEINYEDALVGISKNVNLHVHKLNDLAWCEIDDENNWARAVNVIYPIIIAREKVL